MVPPAFWKEPFLDMARTVWSMPEELWIDDSPRLRDIRLLEKHGKQSSAIDEGNFRATMISQWKQKDSGVELKVRELPGRTRVVFLGTSEQWYQIPWGFWSRIFQAIGHPIGHVLFYADPRLRNDESGTNELKPVHINGGYSYICEQGVVVIYRFEEATRVLLHELLHTACFDKEKGVEDLEAHTEAWTEVLLCALLSRGVLSKFNTLWKQQVNWILNQVNRISTRNNVNTKSDYAWRYITGKKEVLEEKGFIKGISINVNSYKQTNSLRFTTPQWDELF